MYFNKKIVFLNIILTGLIVLLHAAPLKRFGLEVDMSYPFIYLTTLLCQAAVPLFFFVSAVLFYRTCSSYEDIWAKLKRRVFTLLVPYLLWNAIFVAIYFAITHIPVLHNMMNMGDAFTSFKDIIIGIVDSRFTPLWFIKELMFYTLLAPVLFYLLKYRYIYIPVLLVTVVRGAFCEVDAYDNFWMWLPIYICGAYIGHYQIEIKRRTALTISSISVFAAFFVAAIFFKQSLYAFRLVSPLTLWFLVDWVLASFITEKFVVKKWMKYSFFIFCTHYFVLNVLEKIIVKLLPPERVVLNLTFILVPAVTILLLVWIAGRIDKYRFYKVLTGNR